MIAWTGDASRLRPHVKTHKLPQIVQLKLAKGIQKFKASTIAEVEMVAAAGGKDILLAMQPVGANFHRLIRLIQKFPQTQVAALVDNSEHLEWMHQRAAEGQVRVRLFVDLNVGMNRTGIAVGEPAHSLCHKLISMSHAPDSPIAFGGLHAYDGHLTGSHDEQLVKQADDAFEPVWKLDDAVRALRGGETSTMVVSGTPTSPILSGLDRPNVEVSAGTTVLWDWGQQKTCPDHDFLHAAVLLMRVVSKPTRDRLCLDLGHKSVASEFPPPRVHLLDLEDAQPIMHSEEHLVIETARASEFPIGSTLYGIPYHVCPTIALHSHVWCVRDGQATESWPVVARDRRITL